METRLGMYAREIKDMKTFISDPDKRDGALKRLDVLETKVDEAMSSQGVSSYRGVEAGEEIWQ